MDKGEIKQKVARGAVWSLLEKISVQAVRFVVSMILARLLTPDDFGTVALTTIFFTVTDVLVDGGFAAALIQKKDSDQLDFNSVFYFNLSMSLVMYGGLWICAPLIARFYHTPMLVDLVRVSGLCLIFNAFNAVQNAELNKKMLFNLSFRISLITSVTSAVVGVGLAFSDFGVWALVYSSLGAGLVGVIARWYIIAWRPRLMFSLTRLKPLFRFGWKMALSSLIWTFFDQLNGLLIGRFYTKSDLAYVNRGNGLPYLVMSQVDGTIGAVSFPALVQLQDNHDQLRNAVRKMIKCSTFLAFPAMTGMAICSKSLIRFLYGSQWESAVPFMMLACFGAAIVPLMTINLKAILAIGRSDLYLKMEIIKKCAAVVVLVVFLPHGVFPFMAATVFVVFPLSIAVNAWPVQKLLGYSIRGQLSDAMSSIPLCAVEACVVLILGAGCDCLTLNCGPLSDAGYNMALGIKLVVQVMGGAVVYIVTAYFCKMSALKEYYHIVENIMRVHFPTLAHKVECHFECQQGGL